MQWLPGPDTSQDPMITIEITDEFTHRIDQAIIQEAVNATLGHHAILDVSLTVVITGDHQVHQLNQQYRGVDASTDVLSFPAGYLDPESGTTYLGDVILSYPRAAAQALERGESIEDEIQLLVVHGTLHTLGYDHESPGEKAQMWASQDAILKQLGISGHIVGDF